MPTIQPLSPRCLRWILIIALLFLLPGPLPASANLATAAGGSDGTGFDSFADDNVSLIVVQPDGMILVAGPFNTLNGQARHAIGHIYPNGALDTSFAPQISRNGTIPSTVRALLLQPDGKIVIGGDFTAVNGQPRSHLARLNPDGSLDGTFTTGADDEVYSLLWLPENKILVGGIFSLLGGGAYPGLGRLNLDGSLDESFHTLPFDTDYVEVSSIVRQPDGRLLIGGYFHKTMGEDVVYSRIERLSADGVLENTFNVEANGPVSSILVQGDKIIIGGAFYTVNAQAKLGLARLNTDGTLDDTFANADTGWVFELLEQPDGKILVAGNLYSINGVPRDGIARLNADGSLDTDFDPNRTCPVEMGSQPVYGLALQPNGKILVGGLFDTFGCQPRTNLARIYPDGTLDYTKKAYLPLVSLK